MKALGVYFSTNEKKSSKQNNEEKIDKIKKLTEKWSLKKLTLLASQLVYILTPLQTCPNTIKEINAILFKFLWDKKGDKIKRTVMINDYEDGGTKMLDINSFNRAL